MGRHDHATPGCAHRRRVACAVLAAWWALPAAALTQTREPEPLRARILAAEDARPGAPEEGAGTATPGSQAVDAGPAVAGTGRRPAPDPLAPLFEGLTSLPEVQVLAVRALGRLERADLAPRIVPLLTAFSSDVRSEAANALAQAVVRGGAPIAFEPLRARIALEADAGVRGVLARSLGRLPYRTAPEVEAASAALLALLEPAPLPAAGRREAGSAVSGPPRGADLVTVLGVAKGFESLARGTRAIQPLGAAAQSRLALLLRFGLDRDGAETPAGPGVGDERRVRRLSVGALSEGSGLTKALTTQAVTDPDAQVRRLAVLAAGRLPREPWVLDVFDAALFDADPRVRIEALRQRAQAGGRMACQAAKLALADADTHVVLTAIDLAGRACAADVDAVQAIDDLAVPPPAAAAAEHADWHRAAHALVALARLMPERTRARLPAFVDHPVWHVRQYAARAAGTIGAVPVLELLAQDEHHNVIEAAVTELMPRAGHRADPLYLGALESPDGQLVRTAARALAGTPRHSEATRALLQALARVTVELRETSRDVRMAILERLEETGVGAASTRDELAAYLTDFDPAIATRVAALLTTWTGSVVRADPRPLRRVPPPSLERLAALGDTAAVVTMAGGGSFRVQLFADEAPTNVDRFARLAAAGAFKGLTFHRVEPTFVIQGGSPGANEYAGHDPFTRDEVGLRSHLRGTVGISTRGRDTGDGQIFVNLVDNVRLDHLYTIIGAVVDGLDVVDGILEGDVIKNIRLTRGASGGAALPRPLRRPSPAPVPVEGAAAARLP